MNPADEGIYAAREDDMQRAQGRCCDCGPVSCAAYNTGRTIVTSCRRLKVLHKIKTSGYAQLSKSSTGLIAA
jgi:hypothetical protein